MLIAPTGAIGLGLQGESLAPTVDAPFVFEAGGSLVANCRHGEPQTHYCIGYVAGVVDLANLLYLGSGDERLHLCLDRSLSIAQVTDQVVEEIARHREDLVASAATGVIEALKRIHACR